MCQMVSDPSAIIACWRDSAAVPALGVEIPDGFDYRAALLSEAPTPIRITGKIRAIVLPPCFVRPILQDEYWFLFSIERPEIIACVFREFKRGRKEGIHPRPLGWRRPIANHLAGTRDNNALHSEPRVARFSLLSLFAAAR